MKNERKKQSWLLFAGILFAIALFRLIPHPYNFTPVIAMALFGGALFKRKPVLLLLPLVAFYISDIAVNYFVQYEYIQGSFFSPNLAGLLGMTAALMIGYFGIKKIRIPTILGAGIAGSIAFFLISNFIVWLTSGMYTIDITGLIACFSAALPFFQYTLVGTLFYATLLFGVYQFVVRFNPDFALIKE